MLSPPEPLQNKQISGDCSCPSHVFSSMSTKALKIHQCICDMQLLLLRIAVSNNCKEKKGGMCSTYR